MKKSSLPIIPIFFATDDKYAPNLQVALQSIISQASAKYEYHFHVLGESLSDKYIKQISALTKGNVMATVHDMTELNRQRGGGFHCRDYYSKATYFRIFIPELFPQYDKAIYLDCDVVLNADISEMFNYHDLLSTDHYAAAVTCETCYTFEVFYKYVELYMGFKQPYYFNAGVLVLNLKALRRDKFEEKFFDLLGKIKFELIQDQDYLNALFRGKVLFLPKVWNKIPVPKDDVTSENVKLVHYNLSFRPWRYDGILFEEIFWKHAKASPAYEELVEGKKNYGQDKKDFDNMWMGKLQELSIKHWELPIEQTYGWMHYTNSPIKSPPWVKD